MTWIAPVLSTLAVGLAFALIRRVYRNRTARLASAVDPKALEARWGRFARADSAIGVIAVLGLGGGGTVLLARGIHALVELYHAARPGTLHHLCLSWYYWALCSAPLVLSLLVPLGLGVYRLVLGDRFAEYRAYGILRHGYDSVRVAQVLLAFLLLVGAVGFPLGLDTYALATDKGVVINPYFGFDETAHSYADVVAIHERIKTRKDHWLRSYRIAFADATEWRSEQLHEEIGAPPPDFITAVSKRSGKPIEQREIP